MRGRAPSCLAILAALSLAGPAAAGDPDPTADPVPAYEPILKAETDPVQLTGVHEHRLPNGLTIYTVEQHELPVVTVRLVVPRAGLFNPLDQPGLTQAMGTLLAKGTATRSAMEVAGAMDYVGGVIDSGAGWNGTFVEASVLTRDLELALELVADVALRPSFPAEELERYQRQTVSDILYNQDDPGVIADQAFARFVYGDHPYAFPLEGTAESVQALTRDDLVAHYERLFVPQGAVLVVAGDVQPRRLKKFVKHHFGGWSAPRATRTQAKDPTVAEGGQILVVDRPDAVQSEIRIGYVLAPYNMGDETHAFQIMDYCFGRGGFSSRLMRQIRAEMGLTYGIYSSLDARQQAGAYTISSFTKTETTAVLIEEVQRQMERAIADGFDPEELRDAQAYLIGSYPGRFETPGQIAGQIQSTLLFGFGDPVEWIGGYREAVGAVTLEQVDAMARQHLRPDDVRIVVVGNAAEVVPLLEPLGTVQVVEP